MRQSFPAAPARVFQAWLDTALAGRWLFAMAGRPMTRVAIEARVGGRFRFADESGGADESGRYVEILPRRRLVFSLVRPGSRHGSTKHSTVTVEFRRREGGCLVSLTHAGLPSDYAGYAEARWEGMLYGLGLLLDEECGESIASINPPARLRRVGPL